MARLQLPRSGESFLIASPRFSEDPTKSRAYHMTISTPDIIDRIVGIAPGSHLDEVRTLRPEARQNAQKSYSALFEPENPGDVSTVERFAVATFVAGLHRQPAITAFYAPADWVLHRSPKWVRGLVDRDVSFGR